MLGTAMKDAASLQKAITAKVSWPKGGDGEEVILCCRDNRRLRWIKRKLTDIAC